MISNDLITILDSDASSGWISILGRWLSPKTSTLAGKTIILHFSTKWFVLKHQNNLNFYKSYNFFITLKEAHEHQIHDCIRRHFNASNTQLNPSQRQSMTGSPPPGIPPLLQLHESSPTLSREQLDQQHLLLMQLQGRVSKIKYLTQSFCS